MSGKGIALTVAALTAALLLNGCEKTGVFPYADTAGENGISSAVDMTADGGVPSEGTGAFSLSAGAEDPPESAGETVENTADGTAETPDSTPTDFFSTAEETQTPTPDEEVRICNVTFQTGLSDPASACVGVKEGSPVAPPEICPEDKVLRYWTNGEKVYDFSLPVTEDLTLQAVWLERTVLPATVIELRDAQGKVYSIDRVDRENYVTSTVSILNGAGTYEVFSATAGFRGRGNGSWSDSKKCFKIRFDEKQPLFGREKNRHWVLLACTNFKDTTLLRNYTAYNLAGALFDGLEYTTNAVLTDLYINGDYRGVYVLCEQVRVGRGRVEIDGGRSAEDAGFLIEYDAYAEGREGIDYFSIGEGGGRTVPWGGRPRDNPNDGIVKYDFTVHYPDSDDLAEGKISEEEYRAQVAYIRAYILEVYTAATVDHDLDRLSELVDMESLVDIYILEELYKNTDAGYSSFYMYKKPGGKLYFGPPWDFDGTTVAARGEENDPNGIYVAGTIERYGGNTSSELFIELYKTEGFRKLVSARWEALSPKIRDWFGALFTEEFYETYRYAVGRNFVRWSGGRGGWGGWGPRPQKVTQETAEKNWISDCRTLYKWFSDRIAYLDRVWKT